MSGGEPDGPDGVEYHRLPTAGRSGPGWGVLAIVAAVVGFLVAQLVVATGFQVYYAVTGADVRDSFDALLDTDALTPAGLAFVLLAITAAIPFMMVAYRLVIGLPVGWLMSVARRMRWRWLLVSLGVGVAALVFKIVLAAVVPAGDLSTTETTSANDVTRTTVAFLVVIVLFVPLQAAAEEYVFRGLMLQGCGTLVANAVVSKVVAVVVPAVVFALFHGSQSVPVFIDRLAFGVAAGILAIATGGLEAAIAFHVANNWIAFLVTLFFGDITTALNPTGGDGWDVVVSVVSAAVFVLMAVGAARAMGLTTRAVRTELVGPVARV
ncbi:CPBP family intramembrane glutamic endopeptidase [Nocardioides marinquilinus]|uniref:CPBP family intramembrane glutamic endopeptidase n=1 Tax=Nocardioides marinquilinus TaxID=1210400 RepID=UPI0031E7EF4A